MAKTLANIPGLEALGPAFWCGITDVAERLETDPDYLTAVMRSESGFNPAIQNKGSRATGLIQFMPRTAERLGTTVDDLKRMSAVQQLEYVEAYYRPHTGRIDSAGTAYMFTFLPAFARQPDGFVLGREGDETELAPKLTFAAVYSGNSGFDTDKDGEFTVGDVKARVNAILNVAKGKPRIAILECPPPPPRYAHDDSTGGLAVLALVTIGVLWGGKKAGVL